MFYLLPENVTPSEMDCVTFFYPKDELYRQQLIGVYNDFAMWYRWERDEDKRGKDAARAWLLAICKTEEMDYMPEINVVVNNDIGNSGCCCSGSAPTADRPITSDDNGVSVFWSPEEEKTPTYNSDPYVDPEDGITLSPSGSTDWTPFNSEKCRRANYFADNVIEDLQRSALLADSVVDEGIGGVLKFLSSFLPRTWRDTLGAYALTVLGAPAIIEADEGNALNVFEIWASNIDRKEIVDILYDYTTTENAYIDFHAWADASIASLSVSETFKGYLTSYKDVYTRNMFRIVTDFINEWPIPSDYVGITDCTQPDPANWPPPWYFPTDLQGWITENEVNTVTEWAVYPGNNVSEDNGFRTTFIDTSAGGSPFSIDYSANIESGNWIATTGDNVQIRILFNYLFTTSRNFDMKITYADDTFDSSSFATVGNNVHQLGQCAVTAPNNGKEVKKITVTAHSDGNDDGYFPAQGVPRIQFSACSIVFA